MAYENNEKQLHLARKVKEQSAAQRRALAKALASFFGRAWFRRAWIVQKVIVDFANPPLVLCGCHEIGWHLVWKGFFTLSTTVGAPAVVEMCGEHVRYILPVMAVTWDPQEILCLSYILRYVNLREATLPQDKLFALFGLAGRYAHQYPAPDYKISVRNASLIYTRAIIATDKRLMVLNVVDPISGPDRLPTWALKLDRTSLKGGSAIADHGTIETKHQFSTTLQLPPVLEHGHDAGGPDPIFRLRGLPLDRIVRIYRISKVLQCVREGVQAWPGLLDKVRQYATLHLHLPSHYRTTGESVTRALVRTLCADNCYLFSETSSRLWGRWDERKRLHVAYMQQMAGDSSESDAPNVGVLPVLLNQDELVRHVFSAFGLGERHLLMFGPFRTIS